MSNNDPGFLQMFPSGELLSTYNHYIVNESYYSMRTESHSRVLEDRTQEILRMDDSILSVAIVDSKGRTLVSQSKFGAKDVFAPKRTSDQDDFGTWTRASLEMIKPFKRHFGTCEALAAFYKDVKVLIVPLAPMNIHFVIVCLRSANAELIMCKFHGALAEIDTISKSRNRPRNGIKT